MFHDNEVFVRVRYHELLAQAERQRLVDLLPRSARTLKVQMPRLPRLFTGTASLIPTTLEVCCAPA